MRSKTISSLLALALGGGGAIGASGQSATFLAPDAFEVERGESVRLQLMRAAAPDPGDAEQALAFEPFAWRTKDVKWFFQRSMGIQNNADTVTPADDDGLIVTQESAGRDIQMFGLDIKNHTEEVDAEELLAFVDAHMPRRVRDGLHLPKQGSVSILRCESAKSLVRVRKSNGGRSPSAIALSKSGQRGEMRPIIDPTSIELGSIALFRLYIDAPESAGQRVTATNLETGRQLRTTTNADGLFQFQFTSGGTWFVEAHAIRQLDENDASGAQYELTSVTLTFPSSVPAVEESR